MIATKILTFLLVTGMLLICLGIVLGIKALAQRVIDRTPEEVGAWIYAVNDCLNEGKYIHRPAKWRNNELTAWGFSCEETPVIVHRHCEALKGEFYLDKQDNVYCGIGPKTPGRAKPIEPQILPPVRR